MQRIVSWFSKGTASAVATKLTLAEHRNLYTMANPVVIACCETNSELEDNERFARACAEWYNQEIIRLRSDEYADTYAVWEDRKYIAGIKGAPCTGELKVAPRLTFQRPDDIHVFGYTADRSDVARAQRFRETYPELTIVTPLIDKGLTKAACLAMVIGAGIEPPETYALGFHNANCMPCGKATAPGYWALVRRAYPERFARFAEVSRRIGARCLEIHKERFFVDELPADWPTTNPISPACDFLCHLAEQDIAA